MRVRLFALFSFVVLSGPASSLAAVQTWIGPNGNWSTGTNWSGGIFNSGDAAIIQGANTTFDLNGFTVTTLTVGNATGGSVLFNAGVTAFSTDVSIGGAPGISGAVTVDTGATWTISGNLFAGHSGPGTLTISNGGGVDVGGNVSIGELNTATGRMLVTGVGSASTISGNLSVGKNLGSGFYTVANGGYATVLGDVEVGTSGGVGSVLITGTDTSWDVGGTYKGDGGSFTLADGAMAFVTDMQIGTGTGTHTVVVTGINASGTNSILMAGITSFSIGETGHGVLTISEGGIVFPTTGLVILGAQAGSSGTINIGSAATDAPTAPGFFDGVEIDLGAGTGTIQFNHTATAGNPYFFTDDGTNCGCTTTLSGAITVIQTAGYTGLIGTLDYSGPTIVNGGGLLIEGDLLNSNVTVNSGGLLGGSGVISGSVTVNAGGYLAPGRSPGILTIGTLTLNPGATTVMEVNGTTAGTQYDQIVITGTAALAGTLQLKFGYTPHAGDTFTLITGGTLTGDFDTVISSLGNALRYTHSVTTDYNLTVTAIQTSFAPFANTPNQIAIANALDAVSAQSGMASLIDYLNSLPGSSLPNAFDLISPVQLTSMNRFSFANSRALFSQLGNRFSEIRSGQQFSSGGLTIWDPGREFHRNSLLAGVGPVPMGTQLAKPTILDDPNFGLFISGQGTFGDVDGDAQNAGFDFTTGGLLLGADYRIGKRTVLGVYAGYQGTDADIGNGGSVKDDSAKFGLYASHGWANGSWLNGSIGGGTHSYSTQRQSIGDLARGDTSGTEFTSQIQVGHDFKAGSWTFGPTLEMNYAHLWIDRYTESGSLAPLIIQAQEADSLRSTLGGRASTVVEVDGTTIKLVPYVNLGWQHEYMDNRSAVNAAFANGTGGVFTVSGTALGRDTAVAGTGVEVRFSEAFSGGLGYSVEANPDYLNQSLTGSMTYRF
ncbi:MAG: hypothetical protein B9S32_17200 [Verrucomicrobia bacterium Tous-C9LFEB]|nr:MAG: hypothetical protein B9S32_17200 [Verrucomicrobia bacterium Tous-C9LFEB]